MTFTIDKGVPIPVPKSRRCVYPWRDLDVGDSFAVPVADATQARSVQTLATATARRLGIRLVTRYASGEVRVWRLPNAKPEVKP